MLGHTEEKIKFLNRCQMFKELGVALIRNIAESSEEIVHEEGNYIFFQGEDTEHFYFVVSGRVDVRGGEMLTGQEVSSTAGPGSLVGYAPHLLSSGTVRQGRSARVATKSTLLKIDASVVKKIKDRKEVIYRDHREAALREHLALAPQHDIVKHLRADPEVMSSSSLVVLTNGERIFEEGDPSDDVYFLLGGTVRVVKKANGNQEEMVARLRPGQVFGEIGLEGEGFRHAGVEAEGVCVVMRIDRHVFRALLERNPDLNNQINRQAELYSSKRSGGFVPRAILNMRIATKVSALTLLSILVVVSVWFYLGTSLLNENFSSRIVSDNARSLHAVSGKLDRHLQQISSAEAEIIKAVDETLEAGKSLGPYSHRQLDVYFLTKNKSVTLSVPSFVEEDIISSAQRIVDGEVVSEAFRVSAGEGYSAYYKTKALRKDGELLGVLVSVFDPVDLIRDESLVFTLPGADPYLGSFPGRRKDLDRQPEDFLEVGLGSYTVARHDFRVGSMDFTAYSWTEVTADLLKEKETRSQALLTLIIGVLFAVTSSHILSSMALRPIRDLSHSVRRLTEGQRSIPIPFSDRTNEIGQLAGNIDQLQHTIQGQEIIVTEQMIEQQRKVQRQEEVKVIIQRFEAQFAEYIGEFLESVKSLSTVSAQLLDGSVNASDSTDKILDAFRETQKSVEKVERLSSALTAATGEIEKRTDASKQSLGEAVINADIANSSIIKLDTSVDGIGSIIAMIKRIAEKTRLLALNATIEAAKAGPSGRGFGVVAQEVRNLASQTSVATSEIQSKISDIEVASKGVVGSLESITNVIERMQTEQNEILAAVQTQSEATQNITLNIDRTSSQAKGVSESMDGISTLVRSSEEGSQGLNASAQVLKEKSDEFSVRISEFLRSISK